MQGFSPRLKPVNIASHLSPEVLGVIPGWGEGSPVRRVGRTAPAALRGQVLVEGACGRQTARSHVTLRGMGP